VKKILVLEDEPGIMALIRLVLSKEYIVLESTTAAEAFQRFQESDNQIHLVIADVTLPVSSGIDVALELRSMNPFLRIILTSGYPRDMWPDQESAELNELPSDSVATLQKPFTPATLRQQVEALIGPPVEFAPAFKNASH
jgi:CheY-like chemotaxis protein